jgi:hypothetical protein
MNASDDEKYVWEKHCIQTSAREYLENEFCGLAMSSMNSSGDKLFHSRRPCSQP